MTLEISKELKNCEYLHAVCDSHCQNTLTLEESDAWSCSENSLQPVNINWEVQNHYKMLVLVKRKNSPAETPRCLQIVVMGPLPADMLWDVTNAIHTPFHGSVSLTGLSTATNTTVVGIWLNPRSAHPGTGVQLFNPNKDFTAFTMKLYVHFPGGVKRISTQEPLDLHRVISTLEALRHQALQLLIPFSHTMLQSDES